MGAATLLVANGCSLILGLTPNSAGDAGEDGSVSPGDARHDVHARADAHPAHDAHMASKDAAPVRDAGVDAYICCTCNGGTEIDAGCLRQLAADAAYPITLAVDSTRVYWANYAVPPSAGTVVAIVKAPGGVAVTLASGQNHPLRLVVDSDNAYWTDIGVQTSTPGGTVDMNGAVVKVPLAGGGPVTLAANLTTDPYGIAVGDGFVFWTNYLVPVALDRVPIDGGAPMTIPYNGSGSTAIAVAGGNLYWVAAGGGVWTVPVAGGTPLGLGGAPVNPTAIAVGSNGFVYWLTPGSPDAGGTVEGLATPFVDGGVPTRLETSANPGYPFAIAVDDTNVYWTEFYGNRVMKMPLGGGLPTTILERPDASNPAGLAVDGTSVYWTEYSAGRVMMLTPE